MSTPEPTDNSYDFAAFRFDGQRRRLLRGDEPVLLSPKATELLILLLSRGGKFISKEEIFEMVWPDTFVEDGVLTQNIYTLRKALGKDADGNSLVETKSRLGYRISVPVSKAEFGVTDPTSAAERNPQSTETVASPPAKNTSKFAIAFLILIVAAVSAIFAYQFLRVETVETVSRLDRIKIQRVTDTADIQTLTLSADGNFVAYTRAGAIYVMSPATNTETKLDIPNVAKYGSIQFSTDANFLYLRNRASVLIPSDVLKVSRFGGLATKIADNVWGGFSVSENEKRLVFARAVPNENRHTLMIKDLLTGNESEVLSVNAPEEIRLRAYPALSRDGERVAIIIERQGKGFDRIIIFDQKTGQTENLEFKNFAQVDQVLFLPKKNALLVSARESKFYQLFEVSLATKKINRVTNDLNTYQSPSISADGRKLLTTQYTFYTNLWNLDAGKPTVEKQITAAKSNRDGFYGIAYLPDGDMVYGSNEGESGDGNLWRIRPATGERRQLTVDAGKRNEFPVVAPDGNFIYFVSDRSGKTAVWRIGSGGENPKQITTPENGSDSDPQISPDGTLLYFIRKAGKSSTVVRKSLAEGTEEFLAATEKYAPNSFLALSPDGKRIAFQSLTEKIQSENAQQNFQIAVMDLASPQNPAFYNLGGRKPQIFWKPEGDAFYFIAPSFSGDEIRRVSTSGDKLITTFAIFPKQEVYFIATAPNGETMTISRGERLNDAVLLTNFE